MDPIRMDVKQQAAPRAAHVLVALLLCGLGVPAGCEAQPSGKSAHRGPAAQTRSQAGLFDSVADNLDRLEDYDTNQIFAQICDRLNQWYLQEKPKHSWQSDPLLAELSEPMRKSLPLKMLDSMQFYRPDARYLQETVWLRDASRQARADQFNDLDVAQRLFDWTVRNIQLESDDVYATRQNIPHRPLHTLLLGLGTARERAWVFTLLARQQGLDVVLLGIGEPGGPLAEPWLPALVAGDQLYLFDGRLGLPIPGPEGRSVATLAEVAADDALLRKLDLDADHPYPAKAEDFQQVTAYVEASPWALSKRMALVESRLTGKHKLALTSPGVALAERVKKIPHVAGAKLWPWPFEVSAAQAKISGDEMQPREMWVFLRSPTCSRPARSPSKANTTARTGPSATICNRGRPRR